VWDELMNKGKAFDIHAAGMLALDVSRIEAGLLLIDVDFNGSKKALIGAQRYTPLEMGLGRLVALDKGRFVGQEALRREAKTGPEREIVGLELSWNAVEAIYEKLNLAPQIPAAASRVAVPLYREGAQVGKATSTTWSPTLKKMIALGTVARGSNAIGTRLEMEVTVEAVRHRVPATVVKMPFFNPPRKTATPIR
jgi:aminomethyltransferase